MLFLVWPSPLPHIPGDSLVSVQVVPQLCREQKVAWDTRRHVVSSVERSGPWGHVCNDLLDRSRMYTGRVNSQHIRGDISDRGQSPFHPPDLLAPLLWAHGLQVSDSVPVARVRPTEPDCPSGRLPPCFLRCSPQLCPQETPGAARAGGWGRGHWSIPAWPRGGLFVAQRLHLDKRDSCSPSLPVWPLRLESASRELVNLLPGRELGGKKWMWWETKSSGK